MPLLWKDDPAYPLNALYLSRPHDIRPGLGDRYLVVNSQGTGVSLKANTIIPLKSGATWKVYHYPQDVEITDLDAGSFTLGMNYYVYLCDDGSDNGLLIISANSTAPVGYTPDNSRKIGGFHFGRRRNSLTVSDVTNNVVVPNSVWDLVHRPRCSPEGMAYIGGGVWVDIYLASVDEPITFSAGNGSPIVTGTVKSAFNAIPLTGTEGLNGYNFIELAYRSGKRLLTYAEWLRAAYGSPQGNDSNNTNAWSATTNTGRTYTGSVPYAISLMNIVDCVGNVYEWLDEFSIRQDSTSWNWRNPMSGQNVGQLYLPHDCGITQFITGGRWDYGARCGSRCVHPDNWPWHVSVGICARCACDSL
ncbi:hypothetical protein [Thermodesulfovibrio sp.]|uniref:phage major tropism determinant n=1 Tax=Thermodesulfovibrio sp. TaxID=2067987 RepID=UPI00309E51B1